MTPPVQAPYQPYPPFQPEPPRKGSGLAIASMVLGIIALLLSWIPIINTGAAVLALVGLGLAIPALLRARRGTHGGMGMAITGLVTGVLGLLLGIAVLAATVFFVQTAGDCLTEFEQTGDQAQYEQCLQESVEN